MKLRELAHARAGDKGNISNICVIAYKSSDYPRLVAQLTTERVAAHFNNVVAGAIIRHQLPDLGALNFVMHEALGGGVTRSLALDPHGKSLSSCMLEIEIFEGASTAS
jgi:hypothetical protein